MSLQNQMMDHYQSAVTVKNIIRENSLKKKTETKKQKQKQRQTSRFPTYKPKGPKPFQVPTLSSCTISSVDSTFLHHMMIKTLRQ